MKSFVAYQVTLQARSGHRLSHEWHGHGVLPLGHPATHVLQVRDGGLRLRRLGSGASPLTEIPPATLIKGKEYDLGEGVTLHVRGLERAPAAHEVQAETGSHVSVFTCVQDWALESRTLGKDATCARAFGTDALELSPAGQGAWNIKALVDGVREGNKPFARGEARRVTASELLSSRLEWSGARWTFAYSSAPEAPALAQPLNWKDLLGLGGGDALDMREFRRAMTGAVGALGALMLIALLWPKPEVSEEEIIPAQFAQVVMKPASPSQSNSNESASAAPKKAQETAVAQAFRSQALNQAVSGLLKGGMSKLLTQSSLMVANPGQTRALFGSNQALKTADVRAAAGAPGTVQVAAVGGSGAGGYAKGDAKGVAGQGGGQVSLDLSDSVVEEGLTKDEVGEVIHKHLSEIRYCYETALMRAPDLEGKMLSAFVINGMGTVRTSSVKNSTLSDARLEDCILRRLNSWKFPKPKGGVDVPVTYPFVFKALGR